LGPPVIVSSLYIYVLIKVESSETNPRHRFSDCQLRFLTTSYAVGDRLIHIKYLSCCDLASAKTIELGFPQGRPADGALRAACCMANESELHAFREMVEESFEVPAGEDPEYCIPSF